MLTMRHAICVALLTLTAPAAGAAEDGDLLPPGRLLSAGGSVVTNSGHAVVGLFLPNVRGRMSVTVQKGGEASTQNLDIEGKSLDLLPDGRVLIWGYKLVDGVDPYEDSYTHGDAYFVHQIYRIRGSGLELEEELEPAELADTETAWTKVAADLRTWVRMENLHRHRPHRGRTHGRYFAIGRTSSGEPRRTEAVEFYPASERLHDQSAFEILDSDGPILLASYAADLFLIRFHDDGVTSGPVDHLRHVVHPRGGNLDVVWQFEDRVLWARKGGEWLAYDLWNVRYELSVPEAPFLRRSAAHGSPHPTRGFVEIERDGSRHRVKHSWRSPQFENWEEAHVSEWRDGPLPVAVSPNGRHALVLESRSTEEGESVMHARRFGLDLLPVLPPVEAVPVETEGQQGVEKKPGH